MKNLFKNAAFIGALGLTSLAPAEAAAQRPAVATTSSIEQLKADYETFKATLTTEPSPENRAIRADKALTVVEAATVNDIVSEKVTLNELSKYVKSALGDMVMAQHDGGDNDSLKALRQRKATADDTVILLSERKKFHDMQVFDGSEINDNTLNKLKRDAAELQELNDVHSYPRQQAELKTMKVIVPVALEKAENTLVRAAFLQLQSLHTQCPADGNAKVKTLDTVIRGGLKELRQPFTAVVGKMSNAEQVYAGVVSAAQTAVAACPPPAPKAETAPEAVATPKPKAQKHAPKPAPKKKKPRVFDADTGTFQ